jgi:DNA-binding transcriptional regulator YiaG
VLKWVFENAARIFSLIETIVNGITKIIAGDISGMADAVESALARLIAPVVDFLAGYLGFGDLPDKIADTIRGFQEWIEGLLDQAIGWLADRARALLRSLGLGGDEDTDQEQEGDGGYDGQIGKVVNFNAAGESHRLFIVQQSGNAVVMMASQEKPVTAQLDDYHDMAQELEDEEQKAEVIGQINQARNLLSGLDTEADELVEDLTRANAAENADDISAQDDAVERDEDRLATVLKQIREALGIQDTEALKEEVLSRVETDLKGTSLTSLEPVNSIMSRIYADYQPEGLLTLAIKVANAATMEVEVTASASEQKMRRIRWKDIFSESELNANQEIDQLRESLSRASQASYAAVAVDGQQVGSRFESGSGTHAEEGLVNSPSWSIAIQTAKSGVQTNGTSQITLMINRTPCAVCVVWLTDAIADAKSQLGTVADSVTFVLAATGTYRRQARMTAEDKAALKAGVERMSKKQGRPFDAVYTEQEEIWKEDLRSFSTEWKDHDNHEDITYSGLTSLAGAGWQIAGLDAGQPLTARQIELSEIAAKLAEDFGWSS